MLKTRWSLGNQFRLAIRYLPTYRCPLNYTVGYQLQVNRRLSVQDQGGLIAVPFDRYTLKLLEGFGLDPNLSRVIDRSFRDGSSASLGVTMHANLPWYGSL